MSKILATINDRTISDADIDFLLTTVSPEQASAYSTPEARRGILEELIAHELFYLDALDEKLDEKPDFLKELETAKEKLLKSFAIASFLMNATVTDEETKAYYENNPSNFKEPLKYSAKHILVATKEEHDQVMTLIAESNTSFEDLAKEHSTCPSKSNGGDLGYFGQGQMVKEFDDALKDMTIHEIKGDVKTVYGYHIIYLSDKTEERVIPFEEVAQKIKTFLLSNKQNDMFLNKIVSLKEKYPVKYTEV
ncbi:MAG: hypothetical protein HGA49_10660 [Eubacteriaceae bacterium]|nr:hypothetical protein [Eubacteriaceae bacterium]